MVGVVDGMVAPIQAEVFGNPCRLWAVVVPAEREFFIDNLLVRIHLMIEMILVDRPCAMGV